MRVFIHSALVAGQVPDENDFRDVLGYLRSELPKVPHLHGAVIFGSALSGKTNLTSDIDVFIALDVPRACLLTGAMDKLSELSNTAHDVYVPVSWVLHTKEELTSGQHTLRHGLIDHLRWAAENGGAVSQNPCPLVLHRGSRQKEARNYVIHALEKARRARLTWNELNEQSRHRARAKLLDKPLHVARRVLELHNREAVSWSRRQVTAELGRPTLSEISGIRHAYVSAVLPEQLREPNAHTYHDFLEAADKVLFQIVPKFYNDMLENELLNSPRN